MNAQHHWVVAYLGPTESTFSPHRPGHIAETLEAARCLAPPDRTIVVVHESERPWWAVLTGGFPAENIIAEPFDRGTGTGAAAALLLIHARDPDAVVSVIFGPLERSQALRVDEAWADPSPGSVNVFACPADAPLPAATAAATTWLDRLDAVDRSRVSALRLALDGGEGVRAAIDRLYPFLTTLDFAADVIDGGPHVRVALNPISTEPRGFAQPMSASLPA